MTKFVSALVAGSLLFSSYSAVAKDGIWRVGNDQGHITYSAINPYTSVGRPVLLARVERAAKMLCDNEIAGVIKRDCSPGDAQRRARPTTGRAGILAPRSGVKATPLTADECTQLGGKVLTVQGLGVCKGTAKLCSTKDANGEYHGVCINEAG